MGQTKLCDLSLVWFIVYFRLEKYIHLDHSTPNTLELF